MKNISAMKAEISHLESRYFRFDVQVVDYNNAIFLDFLTCSSNIKNLLQTLILQESKD